MSAASKAISGFGTLVKVDAYPEPGTPAPVAIAEVGSVKGPNESVGDIETTNNDSPSTTREYIPGLIEGGEVTFPVNYYKTSQTTLRSYLGVKKTITILLPDASTYKFPGYLKTKNLDSPIDNKIADELTIKVAGAVVFTAGS